MKQLKLDEIYKEDAGVITGKAIDLNAFKDEVLIMLEERDYAQQIIETARTTRKLQKRYFASRATNVLLQAKSYESKLDKLLDMEKPNLFNQ